MDDKQLKKRIGNGETEAFVELYDLHGDSLMRYLSSRVGPIDAQDVLQNIFTRLFRYHRKLGKSTNLAAYLFLTARNEANRFAAKSNQGKTTSISQVRNEPPDESMPVESRLETQEVAARLLDQLDEATRDVVQMKIFSGLTLKEVAQLFDLPEQTVASTYRRAIEKLRKFGGAEKRLETNGPVRKVVKQHED